MESAWCIKCHRTVSLASAIAEIPCPECGGTNFLLLVDDGKREKLLSEAERMMRLGRWGDAKEALDSCFDAGLISAGERNLSGAQLEWRRQCAAAAEEITSSSVCMSVDDFRAALVEQFDPYVVAWVLRDYRGIRLVAHGKTYDVEGGGQ